MQTRSQTKSNNMVGISLLLLVLVIYLVSQVLAPRLKKSRAEVSSLKSEISLAQTKIDSFQTASGKVTDLKDTIDRINLAVPEGRDVPGALTSIEAIAAKDAIALKSSQPQALNLADSALAGGSTQNNMSFSLSLTTDYPHLVAFIKDIENNLRLMKVESLIISPSEANSLNVSMDVTTYTRDLTKE